MELFNSKKFLVIADERFIVVELVSVDDAPSASCGRKISILECCCGLVVRESATDIAGPGFESQRQCYHSHLKIKKSFISEYIC